MSKLVAAGIGILAFATAWPAEAQTSPQRGGTLVMVLTQDPPMVNPNITSGVPDKIIGCMVHEGMVDMGYGYKPKPRLAKTWSISPDGLTYTFDLIDAKWTDGKPMTSEDVKYSLEELSAKYSSVFAAGGRAMDKIETPAPNKVVITMKQPFGPFMISLACEQGGAILPAHVYRGTDPFRNPATLATPVGTGPFQLVEWKRGDYIRLARNEGYYKQGMPYFDGIVAKVITQPAARIQALQAGEVDYVPTMPASNIDQVKSDPKLKVELGEYPPSSNFLFFNIKNKPFDDKRVRQALLMATDRDFLIKNVFFNLGVQGINPFNSQIPWSVDPAIDFRKIYPFDAAKANALLDEAGYKRGADGKRFGVKMVIFATEYIELTQVAIALKSMWQTVGVEVNIVTMTGYTTFSDPALGTSRAYLGSSVGKLYGNPSNYANAEVDRLFDEGERATDQAERAKSYFQLQRILTDDLPAFIIRDYTQVDGISKKVEGMWGEARGDGRYGEGWFAK